MPEVEVSDSSAPSLVSPHASTVVPAAVDRYRSGATLHEIAAENHVHYRTLYRWMLSELGDQFPQLVTETLIDRVADADLQLQTAADKCAVARAREQARFARMDLERRRPELYGEKRQVKHDSTINVIIQRDTKEKVVQPSEVVRVSTNNDIIDVPQVIDK